MGNQSFFGSKMSATMNKKNFFRDIRKIRSGEKGGITTTYDSDSLILVKGAVTSGTIGNAMADKFRFIDEIEATWGGAGGENHGFSGISLIADQSEMGSGFFEMSNFIVSEGKTERFQLLINLLRKFRATDFGKTGIIFDNGGF